MKRKTSITKIASILTVLAMVWGGVACQQPTEPEVPVQPNEPEAPVEPTKYTISFDSGVKSITVEEGTAATKPTDPEKTGYTFGGWLNDEAAYDWKQPVTSNLSLTAKWTAVAYTITYLPDGVEKDTYIKSYTIESDAIVLDTNPTSPDATKPNFVAWHVDSEEGDVVTEIAKGSTGNKTFYAEFSAEVPCVVKFMSGTKEVASTKVKKGNKITPPTGFEKYSLFSDADCTKAFDTNTAITADATIYVKLKTFTISYKVLPFNEEGSMPAEYGKVITEEEINAFAVEIDGYTYKGIFTDEDCTVPFDNTKAITSDLTVYVLYGKIVPLWTPKDTAEKEVSCTMPGYQFALSYEENETYGKVLVLSNTSDVGTYDKMTLTFTNPKNLSGKLLKFDLWGDAVDEQPKVLIISGDKAQSEGYAPQILTPNVWSTGVSTLDSLKAAWSSDNSIVAADLTAVTSIQIAFQNAAANMKYGKIYITDAEGANEEILWTANALSVEDPASWTNATVSYVEDATYGSVYKVETTSEVNYPITNVAFPSPAKDFSAYEYLQITLKASAAPASDNEKIKVSIFTDGTHASEHNGCNIVAEDVGKWKSFSLKLEDFWAAWSSDNSIEKADLTKISNLKIEFGKYVGTVEIAEISLK